jgi:flagellar biosynthesis protein FlhB
MAGRTQTEKATPQRLKKAREKGDFPPTREFVARFSVSAFRVCWAPPTFRAGSETSNR